MRAAIVQSHGCHYEILGCFLQWRLDTSLGGLFDVVALVVPLKNKSTQEWLEFYRGLGLCREAPGVPQLRLMDSDGVNDGMLAEFALILWPSDNDRLLLDTSAPTSAGCRSIVMSHFPGGPSVPLAGSVLIRGPSELGTPVAPVVIPCYTGPRPAERALLTARSTHEVRPLTLCVVGLWTDEAPLRAAAEAGARLSFVSRECPPITLPGAGHTCIKGASVSELMTEILASDAVLVAKGQAFIDSGLYSGCVGTCVSLLVPLLLPAAMMSIFPGAPPAGCVGFSANENPVTVTRRLLSGFDLEEYASDRAHLIRTAVAGLDTEARKVLGALTSSPSRPLGVLMHCIWMQLGNPTYRGVPQKYEGNLEQWSRLNGPVKIWNTPDLLKLVQEHYPQHFQAFTELRPLIFAAVVARFMIVGALGGLYFDLDFHCTRSLRPLLEGESDFFMKQPAEHGDHFLTGMFFARKPRHPFVLGCVDLLMVSELSEDAQNPFAPRLVLDYARSLGAARPALRPPCSLCPIVNTQGLAAECDPAAGWYSYTVWNEGTGYGNWTDKQRALRVVPCSVGSPVPRNKLRQSQVAIGLVLLIALLALVVTLMCLKARPTR
jgi:hypothetical protein